MIETQLLRVTEAAEMAGIGRTLAYEFVWGGEWPSVKIGRALRVPRTGLQKWISEREQEAEERAAGFRGEGS